MPSSGPWLSLSESESSIVSTTRVGWSLVVARLAKPAGIEPRRPDGFTFVSRPCNMLMSTAVLKPLGNFNCSRMMTWRRLWLGQLRFRSERKGVTYNGTAKRTPK